LNADAVAGFQSALLEAAGYPIAARVEIAEGVSGVLKFKRDGIAAAGEGGGEEFRKRHTEGVSFDFSL
jgi:hypothetical protein